MNPRNTGHAVVKRSFWIAFAFYVLIGFEFFYMISPFAVYFYSVYSPGLDFLNDSATLSWLGQVFLPHIVSSSNSVILDILPMVGMSIAMGGFSVFVLGAVQVYYTRLTRKKEVTGGVYRFIRHPQYAALMVSGAGLLILWPRYIALVSFITMLFFYYFLARVEERECETRFGSSYLLYKGSTAMFFPWPVNRLTRLIQPPEKGVLRYLTISFYYVFMLLLGIGMADATHNKEPSNAVHAKTEEAGKKSII